jgi:hypothetical protein
MNTQGKGANFSPYKEESNAKENTQNCCRGPAHGWSGGQHRRGQQQIKTAFACRGVLRLAAANMPRQPWLSRFEVVVISSKRGL